MMNTLKDFNNLDLIQNIDFFHKFDNNLICSICLGFLIDPLECSKCQSNYCKNCLNGWSGRCPKKCGFRNYVKVHKMTAQALDELKIKCLRCSKYINYSKYVDHIEKTCEKLMIKCVNEECQQEMEKINLELHLKNCDFVKQECQECGTNVKRKYLKNKFSEMENKIKELSKDKTNLIVKNLRLENKILKYEDEIFEYKKQEINFSKIRQVDTNECGICRYHQSLKWSVKGNLICNLCLKSMITNSLDCPLGHHFKKLDKVDVIFLNGKVKCQLCDKHKECVLFWNDYYKDSECGIIVCKRCLPKN